MLLISFKQLFMKYIFFICCILISSVQVNKIYSQQHQQELDENEFFNHSVNVRSFDLRSKNLVGTSYIDDEFFPAKVIKNNKVYAMRFNAYQDEMEIEKDDKVFGLQKRFDFPIVFLNNNKVYEVFDYDKEGKAEKGFFVVLQEGNEITLLLKETIEFVPEVEAKTGYDKYQPPKLVRAKDRFYIGYKNYTTALLPTKKSEFLNLFGSKSSDIEKYIKTNKLNIKSAEDLIKIFEYYNSL